MQYEVSSKIRAVKGKRAAAAASNKGRVLMTRAQLMVVSSEFQETVCTRQIQMKIDE